MKKGLEEIVPDVRDAFRTLRKSPGFTIVAVFTLGLGIGANTAIFSLLHAAIFQPLGYPKPEQIGRRVRPRFGEATPWVTVVGVAKDVKQGGVDRATGTELYLLLDQSPPFVPRASIRSWRSGASSNWRQSAIPDAASAP